MWSVCVCFLDIAASPVRSLLLRALAFLFFFSRFTRTRFPTQRSPLIRQSPPQKHGEDRGNEGQTEEEEGAHVGRGCSHGKLQTSALFANMSGFSLTAPVRHERPDKAAVSMEPLRLPCCVAQTTASLPA